jgi:hypothetical protein
LAKAQEEDSGFRIKSAEDVYQVLTDKEGRTYAIQRQDSRVFYEYEG